MQHGIVYIIGKKHKVVAESPKFILAKTISSDYFVKACSWKMENGIKDFCAMVSYTGDVTNYRNTFLATWQHLN